MAGIIWNVIGVGCWIVITFRLYLNLEGVDIWLAICGGISGLHVVDSAIKELSISIKKWRGDV